MNRSTEVHPCKMFSTGRAMFQAHTLLERSTDGFDVWYGKEAPLPYLDSRQAEKYHPCAPMSLLESYYDCEDTTVKPPRYNSTDGWHWENSEPDFNISKKDFPWNVVLVDPQLPEHKKDAEPLTVHSCPKASRSAKGRNSAVDPDRNDLQKSNRNRHSSGAGSVRKLPADFQPLPYSVVVGKCRESKDHDIGNRRLRVLASNYLSKYAVASTSKKAKSDIVSTLISTIQDACPEAPFIRLGKDGRWYTISEAVAREKVGYTFRELLGDKYRSSSKAKVVMRSIRRRDSLKTSRTKTANIKLLRHTTI